MKKLICRLMRTVTLAAAAFLAAGCESPAPAPVTPDPLATPGNLKAAVVENAISVSWDPSAGATGYEVDLSEKQDFSEIGESDKVAGTTSQFTGLKEETAYYIRVRAVNADPEQSSPYATTSATTGTIAPGALDAPANFTAKAVGNTIVLKWDESDGALNYKIDLSGDPDFSAIAGSFEIATGTTVKWIVDLDENSDYHARICATTTDAGRNSTYSTAAATTAAAPDYFDEVTASDMTHSSVSLRWNDRSDADGGTLPLVATSLLFSTVGETDFSVELTADDLPARTKAVDDDRLIPGAAYTVTMRNGEQVVTRTGFTLPTVPEVPSGPITFTTSTYKSYPVEDLPQFYKDIPEIGGSDAVDFITLLNNAEQGQVFIFEPGIYDIRSLGEGFIATDVTVKGSGTGNRPVLSCHAVNIGANGKDGSHEISDILFEYVDLTGLPVRDGALEPVSLNLPADKTINFSHDYIAPYLFTSKSKEGMSVSVDKLTLKNCIVRHYLASVMYYFGNTQSPVRFGEIIVDNTVACDLGRRSHETNSFFNLNCGGDTYNNASDAYAARFTLRNSTFYHIYRGLIEMRYTSKYSTLTPPETVIENCTFDYISRQYPGAKYGSESSLRNLFKFTGWTAMPSVSIKNSIMAEVSAGWVGSIHLNPDFSDPKASTFTVTSSFKSTMELPVEGSSELTTDLRAIGIPAAMTLLTGRAADFFPRRAEFDFTPSATVTELAGKGDPRWLAQ